MKSIKSVVAMSLAAILCFTSICPARGAETADAAATIAGETAAVEEDVVIKETGVPEVGPIIEKAQSERSTEAEAAVRGSVSGDSKVTWTQNTMPEIFVITSLEKRKRVYLSVVQDGYMRVAYNGETIVIEYYDDDFRMTRQGHLSMELDKWGGFYKGEDAYYIVEGQYNKDEVDGTEVLRIIKYDLNWNRMGAGRILAESGWEYDIKYPFAESGANMNEVNGKLYVVAGRQGYDGHQGMMLIRMDEDSFDTEIVYGDFGHSFSQYLVNNGTDLYICELNEGDRCTSLSRFDTNRTGTNYFNAFSDRFSILKYGGTHTSAWAIACYASADDMTISSDNILCLGTSIDQSQYDDANMQMAHNIYLTVTPLSNLDSEHTTVKWLTNFEGDGKSFLGVNITKVNDDRFLILWEETPARDDSIEATDRQDPLSVGTLHYVFVDGDGNTISEEFTASAMVSECKPVLNGNKIVYYASNTNCLDFYTIDAETGKFDKKVTRIAGENASWDYKDGVLSFTGKGALSIDTAGYGRCPLSNMAQGYSTSVADSCWWYLRDYVTAVKIEKGISSISKKACPYFYKLTKVTLPEGLKSIGKEAFIFSEALREISIPDSVKEIGDDFLWTGRYWGDDSHVVYATINGSCTSYAIEYAKKNNISFSVNHKWDTEITKATVKNNGKIVEKCRSCGESASEEVIYYPKTIELSKTSFIYNGKEQKPEVIIEGADGNVISADNYTLTYSGECKEVGSYSVKIDFKGNYSGTVTKDFRIVLGKTSRGDMFNLANNVKVTWKEVPGAKYYKVYREGVSDSGESRKDPVIVTTGLVGWDKDPGLTNGHAYRYRIVASMTGKDDSSGDSPLSYAKLMYRLKTVVIRSAKNTAPGKVTVKYDKTVSGDSYVLQYCERQDMVGAKTKVVLGASKTSYVIGGLKKGKTYYISIRVRKKVDGIDYYTTFGVAKKVTVTK